MLQIGGEADQTLAGKALGMLMDNFLIGAAKERQGRGWLVVMRVYILGRYSR
jgi:hypothetical protein